MHFQVHKTFSFSKISSIIFLSSPIQLFNPEAHLFLFYHLFNRIFIFLDSVILEYPYFIFYKLRVLLFFFH